MLTSRSVLFAAAGLFAVAVPAPAETVATAVYARIGNGYQRVKQADGTFQPEFYALSNGGRIYGTATDITVDRVTYPEVAAIATRLLAQQNYHYAQKREQAKLLVVLQWGSTIAPNGTNYTLSVNEAGAIYSEMAAIFGPQGMGFMERGGSITGANVDGSRSGIGEADPTAKERFETAMFKLFMENRVRDRINEANARVLGYLDDLNDSNDIRRWAGGGDRFQDLIGDVEESRYYIVISAFDFPELLERQRKKLLWQVRVSVRSPGNAFDDSLVAMMKTASKYFGQDSGHLVRDEQSKGKVELGELKFLGVTNELPNAKDGKK